MSDNVTPLHPERERRRKLRKRLLILGGTVVLVLGVVALVVFREALNLDAVRRYFTYLGTEGDEQFGRFQYEAQSTAAFAAYEDGLAVASPAGLEVFDESGGVLAQMSSGMAYPAVDAGGGLVLAWDVGGSTLCAANYGGPLLEETLETVLLDADVSAGGEACLATTADSYRTVLTVLDSGLQERFRWYSSSRYLPLCAVSQGGGQLAAVALDVQEGSFDSCLLLLDTAAEEQEGLEADLGGQLAYDLDYTSGDRVFVVGETSLLAFDEQGGLLGESRYDGAALTDFSLDGNGFAVLALDTQQAGGRPVLRTVDDQGNLLGEISAEGEITAVSAAGRYVAVLTAAGLQIYTSDLTLYAETDDTAGALDVAARADGTVLRIGSTGARLYVP